MNKHKLKKNIYFMCSTSYMILVPALKMKINSYMKAQVAIKAVHTNRTVLMAFLSLGEDPVINSSHSVDETFIQIKD